MKQTVWLETTPYQLSSTACMTLSYISPLLFSIISQYALPVKQSEFLLLSRQVKEASSSEYQGYVRFAIAQIAVLVACSRQSMGQKKQVGQQMREIDQTIQYIEEHIDDKFQKDILSQLAQLKENAQKMADHLDQKNEALKTAYLAFEERLKTNHQSWETHRAQWNDQLLDVLKQLGIRVSDHIRQEVCQLDALAKIKQRFYAMGLSI